MSIPLHHRPRQPRDERGVTLLLALLIVAAITAAGAGAAAIVITQNKTSSSFDTGIAAYYAADMGMERALYTVTNNRIAGSILSIGTGCYSDACEQIKYNRPPMSGQPGFAGGEQYTLSINAIKETQIAATIKKDESYTIDLTSGDSTFFSTAPQTLYITANDIAIAAGDEGIPSAEVQWTFFFSRKDALTVLQPENSTIRVISKLNMKYGVKIDLYTGNVSSLDTAHAPSIVPNNPSGLTEIPSGYNVASITGWIVKIKALSADIPNLVGYACKGSDPCGSTPVDRYQLNSILSITSRGTASGSSFVLNAKVPVRLPPSGIFDYVLFSEQTLEKPD